MYSLHMMTYMTDLLINKHTYTVHVHKMSPYSNSNYLTSTVSIRSTVITVSLLIDCYYC